MIIAMVLFSTSALADIETKITNTKDKVSQFLANEKAKTIAFQKKSWADAKNKWPWTMFKGSKND